LIFSILESFSKSKTPGGVKTIEKIDKYASALPSVPKELHVDAVKIAKLISSFNSRAKKVRDAITSRQAKPDSREITFDDIVFMTELSRVDDIVARWEQLQKNLSGIFAQRDSFVAIVNDLFRRKVMHIAASNELMFRTRSKTSLTPQLLSSGEKQLLIFLSETLLQKRKTSVLIADEPELSLHVSWQEKLVNSIRSVNPLAQIIIATHSPNIVGPPEKRTIDKETLIL